MENEDCYLTRHLWHEWQRRSWRDCHKSRQREQDIGRRIWSRGILLSQHTLQRSEHLSASESHQRSPTAWAVYQVRVPRFYNAWCFLGVTWFNRTIGVEQLLIQIVLWSGTCGMNNTCARKKKVCNCLTGERNWHENSGLLIEKTYLPVKQLRLGDTGTNGISNIDEKGYHT